MRPGLEQKQAERQTMRPPKKGSDDTSSLERFVCEMETELKNAIDAVLDSTVNSEECAVALKEEACWVSDSEDEGETPWL